MSGEQKELSNVRALTGFLVIVAILVAFLYQLTHSGEIQPWMVLLVSVLGLASGATILGSKAIKTGYAVLRGERK